MELSEESSFRKSSLKTEKIYKSLYSPYYYTVKLKNLEISYLKMLHKEFLKKELVIELLQKFSIYILEDMGKLVDLKLENLIKF